MRLPVALLALLLALISGENSFEKQDVRCARRLPACGANDLA